MVFDRFNFMTPSLILFYVFILLFCLFISLPVKVLSSWFMQPWSKFCDLFCLLSYFGNMLWSTLLFVMLRVLRVLTRIVLSVTLCYIFFCSQWLSRWFSRKLVFLLFYNANIIPVSKFLYFFLDRATNATVTHLSASATVLQPWNKQPRFPCFSSCFSHKPTRGMNLYVHTCIITQQHVCHSTTVPWQYVCRSTTAPWLYVCHSITIPRLFSCDYGSMPSPWQYACPSTTAP